jgi:DNA-directed RNA polymerase specialized sigma24 family protein
LGIFLGRIKLSDQINEAVRHPLPHDVVVHGAELVADSRLNFSIEPALLAWRGIPGLYIFHDLIHASPRVKSLKLQELCFIQKPLAAPLWGANAKSGGKFRNEGTFIGLKRNQARQGNQVTPFGTSTQKNDGVGMSRSQLVAEHLPLLRRYARALTGNQASGDAYVGAMLEALLQDPSLLDEQHGPRAGLFRLFTQIWNSVSLNDDSDVTTLPMPSERRLSNITPLPRQAFLLLSLEGFSEEEVAFILGNDVADIRQLSDTAGREMAAEIATDVLIIEDETFIAMDLESLVRNLGHNVIGVARTHSDAVALAKNKKPGLILADIQLADGSSGLDAVNELLSVFEVPVVFITAYPERFLTGERPEPAFLISKPFQPAMVSAVASQALFFQRNSRNRASRAAAS